MVLVSGAGGKTGRAVTAALAVRGESVRAWVRQPAAFALDGGAVSVVGGDLTDPQAWAQAVRGVERIYHICPNLHPEELRIGWLAIQAAQTAAVQQFVYHSVLHPQVEAMPHHWQKLRVEERLFTADLPWTILQPTAYMQNLRAQWPHLIAHGRLALPYPPESRISLVDLDDVAAVAAQVLTETGHDGAIYELVGTPPLTQHAVAVQLGALLGRTVTAEEIPLPVWDAAQTTLAPYTRETLLAMFRYYGRHGLVGNPRVLGWLLGRAPTTLAECVGRWGDVTPQTSG